jgi:hypothetical protein
LFENRGMVNRCAEDKCDEVAPPHDECTAMSGVLNRTRNDAKTLGFASGVATMLAPLTRCISLLLVLAAAWPARADDVPDLNVDPVCRGIAQQAADPGERGGPDLAFARCVKSEQAMRQKLTDEWSTFMPADKATCIGSEKGGLASYTDLATCLEMARDARKLNN